MLVFLLLVRVGAVAVLGVVVALALGLEVGDHPRVLVGEEVAVE